MAIVARPKLNGLGEHWGVNLGNGYVAHNTQEKGAHLTTLINFQQGKKMRVVKDLSNYNSIQIHLKAMQEIQAKKPYDLIANNCETFANVVVGEKPASSQVSAVILSCLALGLLAARG